MKRAPGDDPRGLAFSSGSTVPSPRPAKSGILGLFNSAHILFSTLWYNADPIILLVEWKMIYPFARRRDVALDHRVIFKWNSVTDNNSKILGAP